MGDVAFSSLFLLWTQEKRGFCESSLEVAQNFTRGWCSSSYVISISRKHVTWITSRRGFYNEASHCEKSIESITRKRIEENAMSDVMPADMVWIFRAGIIVRGRAQNKNCRFDSTPASQKAPKLSSQSRHTSLPPHRHLPNCLFLLDSSSAHSGFRCQVCIYSCYIISWQFTLQITETKNPSTDARFLHRTQHSYSRDFTAWTVCMDFLLFCYYFEAFQPFYEFFLPSRTHPHNPSSCYFWLSFFPLIFFCSRCAAFSSPIVNTSTTIGAYVHVGLSSLF